MQNLLINIGFNPIHKGYRYILELSCIYMSGNTLLPLRDNGYTYIAKIHSVSPDLVEKNIQNAISYAWQHGNIEFIDEIFSISIDENKGKPTNLQFIMTIIDYISRNRV